MSSDSRDDGSTLIETSRLRLRSLRVGDAEFVFELVSDPSFRSNIGDKGVRDLAGARRFILEGPWTRQQKRGYGQFLVELIEGAVPIGVCGLLYRESQELSDVGFAILPRYWRRGYAYEAAAAVMSYGKSILGIESIVGLTSETNLGSIRVLEKLGLTFAGTIQMSDDDPGTALYS